MRDIISDELVGDVKTLCQAHAQAENLQPGFSFAVKTTWKNYGGADEPLLIYAQADWLSGDIFPIDNLLIFRLNPLQAAAANADLRPDEYQDAIISCLLTPAKLRVSSDVFLHAVLQSEYSCIAEPFSLLASFYIKDGLALLGQQLGAGLATVPFIYTPKSAEIIKSAETTQLRKLIVIENRGVLVYADTAEACVQQLAGFQKQAKPLFSGFKQAETQQTGKTDGELLEALPVLRKTISVKLKHAVVLHHDPSVRAFIQDEAPVRSLKPGYSPVSLFASRANFIELNELEDGQESAAVDLPYLTTLHSSAGAVSAGYAPAVARYTALVFRTLAQVQAAAQEVGDPLPVTGQPTYPASTASFAPEPGLPFAGEIGLVTGAASGIGKACAESLLARGAVAVGLDINPAIETVINHPNYLGLVCDITDEIAVKKSLTTIVEEFGGLDIMVLNAGLFPKGAHIHSIQLEEFNKVLNINLTSNLILMREAYPFLKQSPRYGRVVMIGSKNAKAPGPGAVAYSTSKAGLIQMMRVAAMEWAPDGIRVNVVNPDSVFDTALYTESVLKARAEYYGMTVEQYKKRNLLKTEITSHTVGEMVAEMCGELFVSITGAQIQVDGGNDRTI
jgi:NAD(P)-dependent dehydrogenase (short-subunit alcohol dehydrogenase family)